MNAYYNEHDPYAAEWLRNLMAAGVIAPGVVDERSIEDVSPDELAGYAQCHFFAGIGVWSYALRRAGWPDHRPVWTGSCPCQPFSSAGKGAGLADERHLWPAWFHLLRVCRPGVVFGEQVASKDGRAWLDVVRPDMESEHYAFAPVCLPVAGFGGFHNRLRTWFVAYDAGEQDDRRRHVGPGRRYEHPNSGSGMAYAEHDTRRSKHEPQPGQWSGAGASDLAGIGPMCGVGGLVDDGGARPQGLAGDGDRDGGRAGAARPTSETGAGGSVADTTYGGRQSQPWVMGHVRTGDESSQLGLEPCDSSLCLEVVDTGSVSDAGVDGRGGDGCGAGLGGIWDRVDWVLCRDPRGPVWRPVEPGTFPLAHGAPTRVDADGTVRKVSRAGALKGFGNAISPEVAVAFIECAMESLAALAEASEVAA